MRAGQPDKWLRGMNKMQQRIEEVERGWEGERHEGVAGAWAGRPARRAEAGPDPGPGAGPGQVLVRVRGAAANFPDVLMCQGAYQVARRCRSTPGIELCGEVVSLGRA